jgi:hypothetical protein
LTTYPATPTAASTSCCRTAGRSRPPDLKPTRDVAKPRYLQVTGDGRTLTFERQRNEQQAGEQQRWNNEAAWHDPQRDQYGRWEQAHWDHDRVAHDGQDRMRWGSARGYLPQAQQPGNGWQQPAQGWQAHGGQQSGGQQIGWQQGSHGNQGQVQVPQQDQQPQWPVRGSAHGAPVQVPIQYVVDRREDNRGADQRQSRGQADGRGQFEYGRDANRDR